MMKKIFISTILMFLFTVSFAQEATKWQLNKAKQISDYVSEKHELSNDDSEFFYNAQLESIVSNAKKIKESGATEASEKQVIYRAGYKLLRSKLAARFGNQTAGDLLKSARAGAKQ
tara:strand:+ start:2867 stop:3214 length:348 start_codon:yes stop_codon:yes gene_type:complete